MADVDKQIQDGVLGLGHIAPDPGPNTEARDADQDTYEERDDANWRSGSRDLDEGGGVRSEVGGTRNYHGTGGATGGDLGNRPE
jgi:hypothetical protein